MPSSTANNTAMRKVIHIDMDAFFAAVEQRDNPRYRGKPIIVGGPPDSRGVVATCSYEARKFGVHSAMPSSKARRLCPQGIFVTPRFEAYSTASKQVHAIFREHAELVEPLSLDEAFLDVTNSPHQRGSATLIATAIRRRIADELQLTASAGISYNKLVAKIATSVNKPNGQFTLTPQQAPVWLQRLPVGSFHGIGRATEAKLKLLGVRTGADLLKLSLEQLTERFGRAGEYYFNAARGVDHSPVTPTRERKSISTETTFPSDLKRTEPMVEHLARMARKLCEYLNRKGLHATNITVKAKYPSFQNATRATTLKQPFNTPDAVLPHLAPLLAKTDAATRGVRLLGLRFGSFTTPGAEPAEPAPDTPRQLTLAG